MSYASTYSPLLNVIYVQRYDIFNHNTNMWYWGFIIGQELSYRKGKILVNKHKMDFIKLSTQMFVKTSIKTYIYSISFTNMIIQW